MAINPEIQYPGKITPGDANYPYGSARNVTTPGDGTGTPWEAALLNDIFGFQQALLDAGDVVPSGTPDNVTTSQYMEALRRVKNYLQVVTNSAQGFAMIMGDSTPDVDTIGAGCVVMGGYVDANKNRLTGTRDLRAILAGYDNEITAGTGGDDGGLACVITGSHHSEVLGDATHTFIAGGSFLTVTDGDYNGIIGGTGNDLTNVLGRPTHSGIFFGRDNEVDGPNGIILGSVNSYVGGDYSSVRSGQNSRAEGPFTNVTGSTNEARLGTSGNGQKNTISGGRTNLIDSDTNAVSNTIGGGENNEAHGTHNSVGGGDGNHAGQPGTNATYASIPGGLDNDVTAQTAGTVAGGRLNVSAGDYSGVTHGRECVATAIYSRAGGYQSEATLDASDVLADGMFAAVGDAQTAVVPQKVETTDATQGTMGALVLPDDTTWIVKALVVARNAGTNGDNAAYEVTGCVKRDTGDASVALVGTPTVTVVAEDSAAWDVELDVDIGSGSVAVLVTGEAAKTIRWTSRVMLSQVSG